MILKDVSFPYPEENLIYDQTLLELAEAGSLGETLRFWESDTYFIVLGRTSKISDDVNLSNAESDKICVLRRSSGGGTVLQGPGCLNYSLVLSYERDTLLRGIRSSYAYILNRICGALKKLGVKAEIMPLSDIAVGKRKFSGNAQCRRRKYLLHHGTILYDFSIDKMELYLKQPGEEPPYRKKRTHRDFLTNIRRETSEIKQAIASFWIEEFSCIESGGILFSLPG